MHWKVVLPAILVLVAAAVLAAFLVPIPVGGQEGRPKPGSPTYTEALTSTALPPPPAQFGG